MRPTRSGQGGRAGSPGGGPGAIGGRFWWSHKKKQYVHSVATKTVAPQAPPPAPHGPGRGSGLGVRAGVRARWGGGFGGLKKNLKCKPFGLHSPQFQCRTPLWRRARLAKQPQGARVCTRVTSVWAADPIQRGLCWTRKCRCCEQLGVLGRVGGWISACPWQQGVRWGSGSVVKGNFRPSGCVSLCLG